MTRVRVLRVLAAAAVLAAGWLALPPPGPTQAVDGLETGTWWQGGRLGQQPPQVPKGGLWVSGSPASPNAISALRFVLDDLESNPLLTLQIKSETATPSPGVVACLATSTWTATSTPQSWIERPSYDCSSPISGQRSLDGQTLLFDLGSVPGRTVDVALVPTPGGGPVPGAAPPTPIPGNPPTPDPAYDVVFEPPSPSSVNTMSTIEEDFTSDSSFSSVSAFDPGTFESFSAPIDVAAPPGASTDVAKPRPAVPNINRPRPLAPAGLRNPGRTDRIAAGVVFCLLAFWWYRLSYVAPATRRPVRLTLHDDPRFVPQPAPAVAVRREGRVPSLR